MSRSGQLSLPLISHKQMCDFAARWLANNQNKCVLVVSETRGWATRESPDGLGWDVYGESTLVECKTSRSDFLADRAKPYRTNPLEGMGVWRWMMVVAGVCQPEEVPVGWGYLEVEQGVRGGLRLTRRVPLEAHPSLMTKFVPNREAEAQHMVIAARNLAAAAKGLVTCRAYKMANHLSQILVAAATPAEQATWEPGEGEIGERMVKPEEDKT